MCHIFDFLNFILFFLCFSNFRSDIRSMATWATSPDLYPWNYNELNICNLTNKCQPTCTQAHLSYLLIRASEGGPIVWVSEADQERGIKEKRYPARAPSKMKGRGESHGGVLALSSPKQSCLSGQHIPHSEAQWSGQRAGQRLSVEGP